MSSAVLTNLLFLALAVFWAWEAAVLLLPPQVPDAAKAALVAVVAFGFTWLPDRLLLALAGAGAVGLLHVVFVARRDEQTTVARAVRPRIPRIP